MRHLNFHVRRVAYEPEYTSGEFFLDGHLIGHTLEYPWRGNAAWKEQAKDADEDQSKLEKTLNYLSVSCIPPGQYEAFLRRFTFTNNMEPRFHIELLGTNPRTHIQIHAGNTLLKDSKGCILVAEHISYKTGAAAISGADAVMRRLYDALLLESNRTMEGFLQAISARMASQGSHITVTITGPTLPSSDKSVEYEVATRGTYRVER